MSFETIEPVNVCVIVGGASWQAVRARNRTNLEIIERIFSRKKGKGLETTIARLADVAQSEPVTGWSPSSQSDKPEAAGPGNALSTLLESAKLLARLLCDGRLATLLSKMLQISPKPFRRRA